MTGEHSLPVLDAAHIRPYAAEGDHDVRNGLLLRSDIHRLFDRGYVTVTPDLRFEVRPRLREDYANGKTYYALHGQQIVVPADPQLTPSREALSWHAEQQLRGSEDYGAGGKTTLMYVAAAVLARRARVVSTTTTHIRPPTPAQSPALCLCPTLSEARAALVGPGPWHRTLARARSADGKLVGFTPQALDQLCDDDALDVLLVEADGSRGRPLKAHGPHEPVLSSRTDRVVLVVGGSCVGAPLDEAYVHRAALAAERLGAPLGARLDPSQVAALLLHPLGALRDVRCPLSVWVQGEGAGRDALVSALRQLDAGARLERVV